MGTFPSSKLMSTEYSFQLQNEQSGKCLKHDSGDSIPSVGTCSSTEPYEWVLYGVDGRYFQLKNMNTGQCVTNRCWYHSWSGPDGWCLDMEVCTGYNDQDFMVYLESDAYFNLRSRETNYCLFQNTDGRWGAEGCNSGYKDQRWKAIAMGTPSKFGRFSICVQDATHAQTSTDTIEARLWYLELSKYKTTEWAILGGAFANKGKCIDFTQFTNYADKDWDYIDLQTCSDDGLAIDSIKYWDVYTQADHTRTVFTGSSCVKDGYFWLEGDRDQCYSISVHLYSGNVYMNPDWIWGQNCQVYGANSNPLSLIDYVPLNNINMMIFAAILVILGLISACCNVYYFCNNKQNKGYEIVSVSSDTDHI